MRGLRLSHGASLDLEQAFSQIRQEFHIPDEIGFRVIVDGEQSALHPILRDEVYRIGREALINAFRHSRAKNIELELKYSPDRLSVLVRDDGCGIDPKLPPEGCQDVGWRDGRLEHLAAVVVGRAVDDSSANASACQGNRKNFAPMIASTVAIETRRAAKFSEPNHEGFIQEASLLKVFQ